MLRAFAGILSDLKGLWLKAWARPRPALFPLGAVARSADATVLRAVAHGPTNGTIELANSEVIASVRDVPAGQFVEIR